MSNDPPDFCPECWPAFAVDFNEARPAGELVQTLYGCDAQELRKYFAPEEWLTGMTTNPLQVMIGTPDEWHLIAALWQEARKARERRSQQEIDIGWDITEETQ